MRSILVAAMVVAMAAIGTGPVAAGEMSDEVVTASVDSGGAVHYSNPTAQVIEEEHHSGGAEFGLALASSGLSLIYHPFRIVFGVVGAALGGFGGWSTGGDLRTAKGLWRPTVEGDYFIRPDHLDGAESFRFNGTVPVHERTTVVVRERVLSAPPRASEPAAPVAPSDSDADEASDELL